MKASSAQAAMVALLTAAASIAPFAPFVVEDNVTDNEATIEAALEARGACIAIDDVEGAEVDSAATTKRALATAQIGLVIYEQPAVAHTPARLLLIEAVVDAITADGNFKFQGFTRFKREKGGIACVADFTAQVLL